MKFWGDEVCAWRYPDAWYQASLGLRLGDDPQCVPTTTAKPTKQLRQIIADTTTHTTRGSTLEPRRREKDRINANYLTVDEWRRAMGYELYKPSSQPGRVLLVPQADIPLDLAEDQGLVRSPHDLPPIA